jgi:hypothetical protein
LTVHVSHITSIVAKSNTRALVGTPISGQILLVGGYIGLGMWTGATLLLGSVIIAMARLRLDRNILMVY